MPRIEHFEPGVWLLVEATWRQESDITCFGEKKTFTVILGYQCLFRSQQILRAAHWSQEIIPLIQFNWKLWEEAENKIKSVLSLFQRTFWVNVKYVLIASQENKFCFNWGNCLYFSIYDIMDSKFWEVIGLRKHLRGHLTLLLFFLSLCSSSCNLDRVSGGLNLELPLALACCVTMGKLLALSGLQLPYLFKERWSRSSWNFAKV